MLADAQLRDRPLLRVVNVAQRKEVEEVAHARLALPPERAALEERPADGGGLRPIDAPQPAQRRVERIFRLPPRRFAARLCAPAPRRGGCAAGAAPLIVLPAPPIVIPA